MATIKARKQANGSTRYTAIVRIRRGTTIVHRESRTFTHHSAAQSWARHREVALENPAELTRQPQCTANLGQLIRWYIDTFESISGWQRTKQTSLEFLERHPLSQTLAHTLIPADLIRHVQSRRKEAAGPATAIDDLIWIGVVRRAAKSVRELPVNPEIVVSRPNRLPGAAADRQSQEKRSATDPAGNCHEGIFPQAGSASQTPDGSLDGLRDHLYPPGGRNLPPGVA